MQSIIQEVAREKTSTIVLTTHLLEEAESLANNLIIMVSGEIRAKGTVQEIKNQFGDLYEIEVKFDSKVKDN
jgi:ATP-binding cassette subfamily A (ABC1) protein 3